MAKRKGKRSSGAAAEQAGASVSKSDPANAADKLPSFDENALSSLTQKIEQKLKSDEDAKKPKKNKKSAATTRSDPKKDQKNDQPQSQQKGKKRDRNGDPIEKNDKAAEAKQDSSTKKDDDVLRQEILKLGGSKEDFDLVAGVESASEVEDTAKKGGKGKVDEDALRKELKKLIGDATPQDFEIPDDEAEESDQEQSEDDDSSESETEQAPAATKKSNDESQKAETQKSGGKDGTQAKVDAQVQKNAFPKEYSKLTIMPRSDWYNTELPSLPTPKAVTALSQFFLDKLRKYAMDLLEEENRKYNEIQQNQSSYKFYSTIMTSGTLSDKISALTLAVQESPIHNTKALESLISLSMKRSRSQAVEVLRALKDMFAQGSILPSDRKLKALGSQTALAAAFQAKGSPGTKWTERDPLPGGIQKGHLIVWVFEDYLKKQYFEVLKILETWCTDEIEFSRSRAVTYVYELLKEKPEQEANLLRLLVNKLGDRARKIASRASYLLLQLEQAHPLMKSTIITALEEFVFRPGQPLHAKYYAVITLNQTILSTKEEKVASQLIDIYFALFVSLLKSPKDQVTPKAKLKAKKGKKKKKGKSTAEEAKQQQHDDQMKEKVISAVLTGVNRAYPFATSDSERLTKHIDTLFRITHSSNFNTSIQALLLIQQLTTTHQVAAERFYRTLYESLLDPRVATSSKQAQYLNLLYRALKDDLNMQRVKAFVKRIMQVLVLHQPSFICGVFFLIRELEKKFPSLTSLVDEPEADESDDEEVFRDVPDEEDERRSVSTAATDESSSRPKRTGYDPRKRDPQHSNADKACLWELLPYLVHFHPSVSVSASQILNHEPLRGKPDLSLHTLSHFLDRFVYKNPKKTQSLRGSSLMQPLAGADITTGNILVTATEAAKKQEPLNSEAFWRKRAEEVDAEEVFFHEYFKRVKKDKPSKEEKEKKKKEARGGDESDEEAEIWKALVESRPELEADESDDDVDLDDLESAYGSDEGGQENEFDEGVIFNDESDKSEESDAEEDDVQMEDADHVSSVGGSHSHDEEDDDEAPGFDMDVSDEDAFRGSDDELPSDLDVPASAEKDAPSSKRSKRRKLRHLPTFASVDDYAALLENEDDGRV